jgi:hypothetical protein
MEVGTNLSEGGTGVMWLVASAESSPDAAPCSVSWLRRERRNPFSAGMPSIGRMRYLEPMTAPAGTWVHLPRGFDADQPDRDR